MIEQGERAKVKYSRSQTTRKVQRKKNEQALRINEELQFLTE